MQNLILPEYSLQTLLGPSKISHDGTSTARLKQITGAFVNMLLLTSTRLHTICDALDTSDPDKDQEAGKAISMVFKNLTENEHREIKDADLLRVLKREGIANVFQLFEGAPEEQSISEASLKIWTVDPANVRLLQEGAVDALFEAEKEAEATKLALKRKIAQAATASSEFQARSLPAKLRIQLEDPEDVKATKRKKIHAFKSKMRKEQIEATQNKRQNAWQQFQTTKGRAKKIGFFTGRKKESIFKSPDDPFGKVGVIGSGKGLTDFQRKEKHLHLKGTNAESMPK